MYSFDCFQTVARMPLSQWRECFPGYRPVGVYNAYVPEEIFQAAGLTPVYVLHRGDDQGCARAHLPSFACWPARSLIDQAATGDLAGWAGMAFAQTCDTVQSLTNIWLKVAPSVPVYHIGMPLNLSTPLARSYLIAELSRLRQSLGVSDEALRRAIAVYNRARELVDRLYDQAANVRPTDLYAVLRAGLLMPKAEYNELLAKLLDELSAPSHPESTKAQAEPRLILVGSHLADPAVYQVVEEAGARVVDDLLDVGHRYLAGPMVADGDPIATLAARLLATLPTPTKHDPAHRRDNYLIERVARRRAHGVIFVRQKFCDPHEFDYVIAKAALDKAGIPSLLVELEQISQPGQMYTRVEAFLEMIGIGEKL